MSFSGNNDYLQRQQIAENFFSNKIKVLVTTDLCMRCAFNANHVVVIVNYTAPWLDTSEDRIILKHYNLRVGRVDSYMKQI